MPDENDATLPPTRLPRALLDAAKAQVRRRDETLSQVVRRALRAYVAQSPHRCKNGQLAERTTNMSQNSVTMTSTWATV